MAQTPARDIIKAAVVDFRFYTGSVANHANNANVLSGAGFLPVLQPAHGVLALTDPAAAADQLWMLADQTAATLEVLLSLDMAHIGAAGVAEVDGVQLTSGDWQIGFTTTPGTGQQTDVWLWASFSGGNSGDTYLVRQRLSQDSVISAQKGSPLHLVLSAEYDAIAPTFAVTACINGVVTTATSSNVNFTMDATPVNQLFDSTVKCPIYLLRMWDSYLDDALVLADLYREARRLLPLATFPAPVGVVQCWSPA